ncbi:unnamed protein product [Mycena citricolor]|uniref:Major facilitator superfamily (MFS) profile domain-containing protein n=1 Tax=Mycena citricolor TaxID=2018698 RepID=A0AAD2Q5R0_9AGAR|nr:unnamed protein product [Mycena citricolor]
MLSLVLFLACQETAPHLGFRVSDSSTQPPPCQSRVTPPGQARGLLKFIRARRAGSHGSPPSRPPFPPDGPHSAASDQRGPSRRARRPIGPPWTVPQPAAAPARDDHHLGALCYGYEQGAYSQVLVMDAFTSNPKFARIAHDSSFKGWSVSTLGLGGWAGALSNTVSPVDSARRRVYMLLGTALTTGAQNVAWMVIQLIVLESTHIFNSPQFVGRFFIGWAVGSLSAVVPLYNSEISLLSSAARSSQSNSWPSFPIAYPTTRVGYGTNFISASNSVSWRLCLAGQGIPALLLAGLTLTLPYTPRWLVRKGRHAQALETLAWLRNMPPDSEIVQLEFVEIQAEAMFEAEVTAERFPHLLGKGAGKELKLQIAQFGELFATKHMFKRTAVACLTQFFQQMTGIDAIVYYAPTIFQSLGLPGHTVSLLAAGVIGVVFVISTLPAIATIDRIGRRPADWGRRGHGSDAHPRRSAIRDVPAALGKYGRGLVDGCISVVVCSVFRHVVGAGVVDCASTNWMTNFVVSVVVPDMLSAITYGTYLFFLMFLLMGIAFAIWVLPETYGKSLEEMDSAFGSAGHGGAENARMERILWSLQGDLRALSADNVNKSE